MSITTTSWKKNMSRIYSGIVMLMLSFTLTLAYDDFPGPYCAKRRDPCCLERQDSCSVPIDTTLCYCDDFCDRDINPDCCPDYYSMCSPTPAPPPKINSCYYKGFYIKHNGYPVQDNCNLCHCRNGTVSCELDICLVEESTLNKINHNSQRIGWTARNYTEFWGRKYSEGLSKRLGTFQPKFRLLPIKHKHENLPSSFNSVEHWSGLISDIRDQGWCASSWALSTAAVASDRFGIQSKGKEYVDLAPQQVLACARRQQGCNGGHLDVAWNYFRKFGLVEEDCYPYRAERGTCRVSLRDDLTTLGCRLPTKVPRTELYKTGPAYAIKTVEDIMIEIKNYGPVQATMKVYHDFFTYGGGIYRHSASTATDQYGYHSVRIVGWGEERVGYSLVKYWVVANSWGKWWGENGYFRIVRGINECDIEQYVLASWANENQLNHHEKKNSKRRSQQQRRF